MVCPHCTKTIAEQDRYLMSVDKDAELPSWAPAAMRLVALFLVLVGVFALAAHALGS